METKIITLPNGSNLEITCTSDFYKKVREHFNLKDNASISDDHVRIFVHGACKVAIDKAEKEIKDSEELDNKTP
tara:strand:+ start:615 stop:836 length:222 start_codon:yes stop_codon:yes gene_type:complete